MINFFSPKRYPTPPVGPPEDPQKLVDFTNCVGAISWDSKDVQSSHKLIFNEICRLSHAEIQFYYRRRVRSRRISFGCRLFSWIFATLGILTPIANPIILELFSIKVIDYGYICFALVGAALLFDQVFGGTKAHKRNTRAQLHVEFLLEKYVVDWHQQQCVINQNSSTNSVDTCLELSKKFLIDMYKILHDETSEWAKELDKSLSNLQSQIQQPSLETKSQK